MSDKPAGRTAPRQLPVAVWLIPAVGMMLPLVAALYDTLLEHRGQAPSASRTAEPARAGSSASAASAANAPEAPRRSADFVPKPPAWSALLAAAAPPDPVREKRLVTQGNGATMPACASCHAASSPAPQPFPRLDGLPQEYIVKQLLDYRHGARQSPIMQPIAMDMADADIAAAARYYAAQPRPAGGELATTGAPATLHFLGDNARALPACTNCHGAQAEGGGPVLPPLVGQPQGYIAAQLQAFRQATRANDDDGVMRAFARRLTDAEIEALDGFYAKGPASAAPPGPGR